MKQAIALTCLMLGVFIESALWDEHIMQSPDELTVTDFELAEEGFSVVLTNAIEDQRAVVENLAASHQAWRNMLEQYVRGTVDRRILKDGVQLAAEMHFRAQRVLSLLEAAREREAEAFQCPCGSVRPRNLTCSDPDCPGAVVG